MLDSFDVMLYSLVLAFLMGDLRMDKSTAGILGSMTLAAAAIGGMIFGAIADRFGRTRALMGSVLLYAVFTGACGLAQNVVQLAIFRVFLGFGMGGEWAAGASLVSETWPAEHRAKALGLMQSSWAIGYALAAIVAGLVIPVAGWRAVFLIGLLPAAITLWIRRNVEEPELWRSVRDPAEPILSRFLELFHSRFRAITIALTLMNACTLFAWWGFNLWVPAYLSLPVSEGGFGLAPHIMSTLVVAMQVGMWFGFVTFGVVSDRFGRKRCYVVYLLGAAALLWLYSAARSPLLLLALGPFVAFFGTGYFTGFGAVTAEIYSTRIRATAQGFTYNTGRIASAVAPFTVGSLAATRGFGMAFGLLSLVFVLASLFWLWIPETRGRRLE
jgi:MFS family permease